MASGPSPATSALARHAGRTPVDRRGGMATGGRRYPLENPGDSVRAAGSAALSRRHARTLSPAHSGRRLRRAVVIAVEPSVGGRELIAVVAIEVAVMELMVKGVHVDDGLASNGDRLVARMSGRGADRLVLHVHEEVDGVRRDHDVNQYAAQVDEVLDGMHRESRPGSEVHVSMVHRVRDPVERRPM